MEDDLESKVREGEVARFVASLNPNQKKHFTAIHADFAARLASMQQRLNNRESLFNTIQQVMGTIRPEDLKELIKNGIARGDAQLLRVLFQSGGVDLTEKAAKESGEGAKVIIVTPYQKSARGINSRRKVPPLRGKKGGVIVYDKEEKNGKTHSGS